MVVCRARAGLGPDDLGPVVVEAARELILAIVGNRVDVAIDVDDIDQVTFPFDSPWIVRPDVFVCLAYYIQNRPSGGD